MNLATMRERMFTIRFSDEEHERLDRLAEFHGLNAAGLIRLLLKKEERALGEELTAKAPAKKSARSKR